MSEAIAFPADPEVAGRLMLSGADALGPNPWSTPRPALEAHGLKAEDLDDTKVEAARQQSETELREFPARLASAFLVPILAVAAAYYILFGSLTALPGFEWAAYLGASLILAAIAAHMQTRHFAAAKRTRDEFADLNTRRLAFQAKDREWLDEQRKRTTTAFWLDEVPKIAASKGVPAGTAFGQEVGKLFTAWGWLVKLNQRSADYGVDIFTSGKEGSAVVQCMHASAGPTAHDIRDLAGSRHAFGSDYGLLVSVHPPQATPQNEFFSEKGQLEFWHLGHILEQCMVLYKQRTGEDAPADESRRQFLDTDGTPLTWHVPDAGKAAAE